MLERVFALGNAPFSPSKTTPSSTASAPRWSSTPQEKRYDARLVTRLGLPDRFIKHASRGEQMKEVGLDAAGIARSVAPQSMKHA